MTRLLFFVCLAGLMPLAAQEPWTAKELLPPAELAQRLKGGEKPLMIYVGPAYLWRVKHITHSVNGGMAAKEEGLAELKKLLAGKTKDTEVILYCGCCPMNVCPNIRPAVKAVKEIGFKKVRLLELPTRLNDDWVVKGYPSVAD